MNASISAKRRLQPAVWADCNRRSWYKPELMRGVNLVYDCSNALLVTGVWLAVWVLTNVGLLNWLSWF